MSSGSLQADLPALRPAAPENSYPRRRPAAAAGRAHGTSTFAAALAGVVIAAVVLVHMVHGGWGLIWLLVPVLLIARRVICH